MVRPALPRSATRNATSTFGVRLQTERRTQATHLRVARKSAKRGPRAGATNSTTYMVTPMLRKNRAMARMAPGKMPRLATGTQRRRRGKGVVDGAGDGAGESTGKAPGTGPGMLPAAALVIAPSMTSSIAPATLPVSAPDRRWRWCRRWCRYLRQRWRRRWGWRSLQ